MSIEAVSGPLDGPWVEGFSFTIPMGVQSKSNFRRAGSSSNWTKLSKFESDVSLLASLARPKTWEMGLKTATLSTRPTVVSFIYARSRLDTANLSKSILDACEGTVFHTDASVRACSALSTRTAKESWGVASFARLDAKASEEDLLLALNELALKTMKTLEGK